MNEAETNVLNCSLVIPVNSIDWVKKGLDSSRYLSLSLLLGKFQTLPIDVFRPDFTIKLIHAS